MVKNFKNNLIKKQTTDVLPSIWLKLAVPYLPIVTNICTMYY